MAWSRLQSVSNIGISPGATSYSSHVVSGSKLIGLIMAQNTTASSVKDASLNAMTKLSSTLLNSSSLNGELSLWAMDTPSGDVGTSPSVTITLAGAGDVFGVVFQEVSGLATGSTLGAMIDGTPGTNTGNKSTAGALTSPTYSSTASSEYLVACYTDDNTGASAVTYTVPSGFTADANCTTVAVAGINLGLAYKNSSNGSESGGYTITAAGGSGVNWGQILCAFKLASGVSPAVRSLKLNTAVMRSAVF